jgi:hypothetical protein
MLLSRPSALRRTSKSFGCSSAQRTTAALLHSEVAQFDFTPLEQKASDLRAVLLEKGWTEILPGAAR